MRDLLTSDKKNIWHPFTPLAGNEAPILIESAKGIYLHTDDGRKIIDAISSWWVNIHGHSNEDIATALAQQAKKLEHVIFAGFTHEPAIQLANKLLSVLPGTMSKVFYSDDGSTAVEVALKIAIQYWHNQGLSRRRIVAIDGAYHGDTFGSMSIGERSLFTNAFSKFLFDVNHIDFPNGKNDEAIFVQFKDLIDTNEVAAFIYEPLIQGAAGMRMYDPKLLDKLIDYAQQENVICIADEVFTGFGRTGKTFASDHLKTNPDIICLSKGITGGTLPLGATVSNEKVVAAFESAEITKTFFHGHSFTANPLACAAANASMKLLFSESCQNNISRISESHRQFKDQISSHPTVAQARSLGTVLAIELKTSETTSYVNNVRKKIYSYFLQRSILLRPLGNVIYVVPPYVIEQSELEYLYTNIKAFLDEVSAESLK